MRKFSSSSLALIKQFFHTNLFLNTERAYIWSLRVSTCQSSLFSKHFIGWKTLKVVQLSAWLVVSSASPVKSDFMLLWDNLFNYCRADLQSHLPDNYLANSFDTWLCIYPFCSKKLFELLMHVYTPILHVLHSICKACDNQRMRGRTSKSARNISNDVRTTTLGSFTLTFASNRDCRMVFKTKFSCLLKTEN